MSKKCAEWIRAQMEFIPRKGKFCHPKCDFLCPTENQQNLWKIYWKIYDKTNIPFRGAHYCMRFFELLKHECHHPEILKCNFCLKYDKFKKEKELKKKDRHDGTLSL